MYPPQKALFDPFWNAHRLNDTFAKLAREAAFIFPIWEGGGPAVDLVTGLSLPLESGASWSSGVGGIGSATSSTTLGHFGNTTVQPIVTSDGVGTGDFWVMVVADPAAEARAAVMISQRPSAGTTQFCLAANTETIITLGPTSGSILFATADSSAVQISAPSRANGGIHCWAGRRAGTTVSLWEDGVQLGSTSGTVQDVTAAGNKFRLGNLADYSGDFALKQNLYLAAGGNSAPSDQEMALLTANPWGLLTPEEWWPANVGVVGGFMPYQPRPILQAVNRAASF